MIVHISSGIQGFDELTNSSDDLGLDTGGIPENTVTLIYGPKNVGKSLFCYGFSFYGLTHDEPCLYLTTDQEIQLIYDNMLELGLNLDEPMQNKMLYLVDAATYDTEVENSDIYQTCSVKNPTDILVKISRGARSISQKSPRFRGVIDSATTILESNNEMLILRVLKTYILRIKESGGTAIITYAEGALDMRTETLIKSMVDNIINLDGEKITIEAMRGIGPKQANYQITDYGLVVLDIG